ncbi:PepSY domain-containing protein [Ochrobactrum sp. Q0168]|uniref:PepSY domain-containing protein n=1 Tax=Ochrobactrum sp. Q0168 TaxID=2793241 RepID=UPI0018EAA66F|nr:PepSY domain-containing protein [Ochrobactrum sp. Q0168]
MKNIALAIVSACLIAPTAVFAQDTGKSSPETPAVATPESKNPEAPVKGANSFTEDQAKSRIEEDGYTGVTGLKLGDDGVWNASAMKGTEKVKVQLDYQGNISKKPM